MVVFALVAGGCTVPSSVAYTCEGGRKIAVETRHSVALFGVPFIGTRHAYQIVGECDREGNLDLAPPR